ncbi:hypothetical protein BT67DRAFT_118803 [Trichocladium antarcticum]|uniref:Uncharacterized protein n=1 Tax=Trichocladium antarcticum TaxID=1450529 RepID=A0AAN6ZFX8_9PEZI|nr:hypothetical protein BT67DRAFT_118803 [Trichocladium antarcticum]
MAIELDVVSGSDAKDKSNDAGQGQGNGVWGGSKSRAGNRRPAGGQPVINPAENRAAELTYSPAWRARRPGPRSLLGLQPMATDDSDNKPLRRRPALKLKDGRFDIDADIPVRNRLPNPNDRQQEHPPADSRGVCCCLHCCPGSGSYLNTYYRSCLGQNCLLCISRFLSRTEHQSVGTRRVICMRRVE